MVPENVTVSRLTWDIVRQRHGIEEQHYVLHVETPSLAAEDVPAVERQAFAELERAGLARGTNVDAALLDTMKLLLSAPIEVHGWVGLHNKVTLGVVVASDGRNGVRAIMDEQAFYLRPVRPEDVAAAMVDVLPGAPPGRGHSITLPLDALRGLTGQSSGRPRQDDFSDVSWMQRGPERDSERDALTRLLKEPRLGGGRVYAAGRDRLGRKHQVQDPITYLDLASGRWLMQQKPSPDGQPWMVAIPATPELLISRVNDLLAAVRG